MAVIWPDGIDLPALRRNRAAMVRSGPIPPWVADAARRPRLAPAEPRQPMPSRDINVIAMVKGGERYVFLFDDDSRAEALKTLGRFAADPDLSFSWHDAAVLGEKLRHSQSRVNRVRFVPPADRTA